MGSQYSLATSYDADLFLCIWFPSVQNFTMLEACKIT